MLESMSAAIRVWSVTVDGRKPSLFEDLDVALAYLRSDIGTNGSERATLRSMRMDPLLYAAEVELEDGGSGNGDRS